MAGSGTNSVGNNHLEINYDAPFGGINTNQQATNINPNEFTQCDGAVISNNRIGTFIMAPLISPNVYTFELTGGPVIADNRIVFMFNCGNYLCCVDIQGNTYIYTSVSGVTKFVYDSSPTTPGVPKDVRVINSKAYILFSSPTPNPGVAEYIPLTSYTSGDGYVGGEYLGLLSGYLLVLQGNDVLDGPVPTKINWSGPYKYLTWDPATDRTAGFNNLTDASKELTGFFSIGNVGYIVRDQGITQMTPTGNGIQPFDFTTLWNSPTGIGSLYPETVDQYGIYCYMMSDSGVYNFNSGGVTDVSEKIRTLIFSTNTNLAFQSLGIVTAGAGICLYTTINSIPNLIYIIATFLPAVFGGSLKFFIYDIGQNRWTTYTIPDVLSWLKGILNNNTITSVFVNGIRVDNLYYHTNTTLGPSSVKTPIATFLISVTYQDGTGEHNVSFPLFPYVLDNTNTATGIAYITQDTPLALSFRQEQVKLARKPTIRRVLVQAAGNGVLNISVNGASFGSLTVNDLNETIYKCSGFYTGENPQLTITSNNFKGYIVKAQMLGTFADGEID